ncbi:hypothetical protein OIO90_002431 [Microbotryomycetes sp. JL221]|nr:hypothetical protein OIO90_002431 [Microbotryomycetes sp. JL221]
MSTLLDISKLDLASTPNTLPPALQPEAQQQEQQQASPLVVRSAKLARAIDGQHTEVVVQEFVDRLMVIVTQLGRIGSLIQVNPPPPGLPTPIANTSRSLFPQLPPPHPSSTTSLVFGVAPNPKAELLHELYASQIGAIVFTSSSPDDDMVGVAGVSKPVLVGIALKPNTADDAQIQGDRDDSMSITSSERVVFGQVMDMVRQCKVW